MSGVELTQNKTKDCHIVYVERIPLMYINFTSVSLEISVAGNETPK